MTLMSPNLSPELCGRARCHVGWAHNVMMDRNVTKVVTQHSQSARYCRLWLINWCPQTRSKSCIRWPGPRACPDRDGVTSVISGWRGLRWDDELRSPGESDEWPRDTDSLAKSSQSPGHFEIIIIRESDVQSDVIIIKYDPMTNQ